MLNTVLLLCKLKFFKKYKKILFTLVGKLQCLSALCKIQQTMNEEWMYYLMELCNSREGYNFDS
jgi:hypothetical protein